MSFETELQQAVLQALAAEPTIAAEANGVFLGQPVRATPPYLVLADMLSADWSAKEAAGREVRLLIVPDRFATSAAQLAGLAGALLGWRPGEFWTATPAELAAVLSALTPRSEAPAGADLVAELQERFPDG